MMKKLITPIMIGTTAIAAYVLRIRPWYMRWGATDAEVQGPQPGDDLVKHPRQMTTRSITINASAADVWPWLVQIGGGRGGFYSYDWLENLMGLDIHSADRILPEFQNLKVGDILPNEQETPDEGVMVAVMEPERALVLRGTIVPERPMKDYPIPYDDSMPWWMDWTWAFILDPIDEKTKRLIARLRSDGKGLRIMLAIHLLMEPSHFIMEHKMLMGIKQRAEALARQYSE
jgi:hypothetical protein